MEKLTKQEIEWNEKYGMLPEEPDKLISMAQTVKHVDWDKYKKERDRIMNMHWKTISLILPLVPQSTPRARWSSVSKTFYVKGAAENKKIIKRIIQVNCIICTMTVFSVRAYFPIPKSSMKGYEIALAEEGLIRPMITKDWDNIGKTYSDMIQNYLLVNDNIICDGRVEKYFSLRPRVEIDIKYQVEFDSEYNKKRVLTSKSYKNLIESQKSIK